MLRIALRRATHSRSFVSTVLLTKAWESETVNELKKEARRRGLSQTGNKATIVTRLRQDDERKSMTPGPAVSANVPQARRAHATEVPGIPSTSEPLPLPKEFPRQFLRVALPDISQLDPESPIQIPLLPDRWGASVSRTQPPDLSGIDAHVPRMVAVAGATTHHGGGPTYNLSTSDEGEGFEEEPEPVPSGKQSFWQDLVDDAGLPRSFKLKKADDQFDVAPTTETSGEKSYSRTLDSDEVRGLWILLGLVAGSWVAAGVLQPSSAYAHKGEEIVEGAVEKVDH